MELSIGCLILFLKSSLYRHVYCLLAMSDICVPIFHHLFCVLVWTSEQPVESQDQLDKPTETYPVVEADKESIEQGIMYVKVSSIRSNLVLTIGHFHCSLQLVLYSSAIFLTSIADRKSGATTVRKWHWGLIGRYVYGSMRKQISQIICKIR